MENNQLTFKNVQAGTFELVYKMPEEVGRRYEELTSFYRGRDFNQDVRDYMIGFVNQFSKFLTSENEQQLNDRLVKYNKLVAHLKTNILSATKTPSVMICGPAKYPTAKKEKEEARIHNLEAELFSDKGKHAKFIKNTEKMFDPVLADQRDKTGKMRKERAEENNWTSFYKPVEHDEIVGYGIDLDYDRVYIVTDGKPCEETRRLLKKDCALNWSRANQRWQRLLTKNAINSLVRRRRGFVTHRGLD